MVKKELFLGFIFLTVMLLATCKDEIFQVAPEKNIRTVINKRLGALPAEVSHPIDNPSTAAKVKLGKLLFFDPILSGDHDVSCASCHHPSLGYAENREVSIGVNGSGLGSQRVFNEPNNVPFTKRNSQTVLNTAFNGIKINGNYDPKRAAMFWDLRSESLEDQALEPIKAFEEMRGSNTDEHLILEEVVKRLQKIKEYRILFADAFSEDEITSSNLAKSIAAFERTLVTNNSRFDQYMRGDDQAISYSEKTGLKLFKKAGCDNCHNGPMFSDYKIHVLGVPENKGDTINDLGFEDKFGFRTPSLRNLNVTAPYMHNGSLPTLLRVLEFYEDISGSKVRNPEVPTDALDPLIAEVEISVKDMRPIISFLNCLNDNLYDREIPERVPSGLKVGGD